MQVRFFIPSLFQPLALWKKDFAFQPSAPALLKLLAGAKSSTLPLHGLEPTVWQAVGYETQNIPYAYYRFLHDFGTPPAYPILCADPITTETGIGEVLIQPRVPRMDEASLKKVINGLNTHLAQDGLQLISANPERWYLLIKGYDQPLPITTTPLSCALGQSMYPILPKGNERYWHRLLNEIQMLLHQLNVVGVDSIWLWGGGAPQSTPLDTPDKRVIVGDSILAHSVALAMNCPIVNATDWQTLAVDSNKCYWIINDTLQLPALEDDMSTWQHAVDVLEKSWFEPLNTNSQAIEQLQITDGNTKNWHCQRSTINWKFWKKSSTHDWNSFI